MSFGFFDLCVHVPALAVDHDDVEELFSVDVGVFVGYDVGMS
jgi:hypothetical protein